MDGPLLASGAIPLANQVSLSPTPGQASRSSSAALTPDGKAKPVSPLLEDDVTAFRSITATKLQTLDAQQ